MTHKDVLLTIIAPREAARDSMVDTAIVVDMWETVVRFRTIMAYYQGLSIKRIITTLIILNLYKRYFKRSFWTMDTLLGQEG